MNPHHHRTLLLHQALSQASGRAALHTLVTYALPIPTLAGSGAGVGAAGGDTECPQPLPVVFGREEGWLAAQQVTRLILQVNGGIRVPNICAESRQFVQGHRSLL
jgi:hypothetical protein